MEWDAPTDQVEHTMSFANIDLDSADANRLPRFVFPAREYHLSPITLFHCTHTSETCFRIKDWLFENCRDPMLAGPGILRMEAQALEGLPYAKEGEKKRKDHMLLFEDIAYFNGDANQPVTIIAVVTQGDPNLRMFYTLAPVSRLLERLDDHHLITLLQSWWTGMKEHRRFFTFIREEFTKAFTVPHSPDYIKAEQITDYCPDILDPENALQRINASKALYELSLQSERKNISEDRYLEELHAAECEIAAMAGLKCAEYLLVKRNCFKAFFEDLYRSDKDINPAASAASSNLPTTPSSRQSSEAPMSLDGMPSRDEKGRFLRTPTGARRGRSSARARIRTEHAHQMWLEQTYHFGRVRTKMLVIGWRELGFLDEGRYLDWVKAGGVLEDLGLGGEIRDVDMDG